MNPTSADSIDDEQTDEASDLFQQDGNSKPAKRAKLSTSSETMLLDLSNEQLEPILVEAVVREVKDMKLVKRVWKEKADLVIDRLKVVSSHWNDILTTNVFRYRVRRILDSTDQKILRLEILHQSPIQSYVAVVTAMKDDVFMLCRPDNHDPFINVCDHNHVDAVKDVIPLPGTLPQDIVACCRSSCVYVLNMESHCFSVLRIAKNEGGQFIVSPWITDLGLSFSTVCIFVSVNGQLAVLLKQSAPQPSVVYTYDMDGSLLHAIMLFPEIHGFRDIDSVIQKPNGNLVLVAVALFTELTEVDTVGKIIRKYQGSVMGASGASADAFGRISIHGKKMELVDSEFNLINFTGPQPHVFQGLRYNSDRNEMVCRLRVCKSAGAPATRELAVCRFAED